MISARSRFEPRAMSDAHRSITSSPSSTSITVIFKNGTAARSTSRLRTWPRRAPVNRLTNPGFTLASKSPSVLVAFQLTSSIRGTMPSSLSHLITVGFGSGDRSSSIAKARPSSGVSRPSDALSTRCRRFMAQPP
jgi:hypothetical protein